MSHHPYEDLYENYEEEAEEEEEQQAPPPRHAKRPPLRSVPLRSHVATRTAQWQTEDDMTALFPRQGQRQAQRPARQTEQRQTHAAPVAQKSHIPHTALQAA